MTKNWKDNLSTVFSTNPDFKLDNDEDEIETLKNNVKERRLL